MTRPHGATALLALLAVLLTAGDAACGPMEARTGETRAVYRRPGTSIRGEPSPLAAAVATLPPGARVRVVEVRQPWLRVSANVQGQGAVSGWLRAAETVEPSALAPNPRPARTGVGATGGVSQRDVSAAGRQLDAGTERGYRASRADLNRAYAQVDALEAATQALDPADSVAFIVGGALGRQGQDYARPALLPPTPPRRSPRRGGQGMNPGDALGRLGGGLIERLGGNRRLADTARQGLQAMQEYQQQLAQSFTPEQEYYLGRAVAANAIAKHGLDPNEGRRRYVRQVGDAIVRLSGRLPCTFGGYHFDVLNSDEVNGISGPGGFVLVTRGAVDACRTEDELAAVLCHELGHVKLKHGEKTLRTGRSFQSMLQGLTRTGATAAGVSDREIAGRLVEFFAQAVGEMSRTSMEHNYGRGAEFEADMEGGYLLVEVFYDHAALGNYLRMLAGRPGRAFGMAATHAPPQMRAGQLDAGLSRYGAFGGNEKVKEVRATRLARALGR